jgi:hypothetical protein
MLSSTSSNSIAFFPGLNVMGRPYFICKFRSWRAGFTLLEFIFQAPARKRDATAVCPAQVLNSDPLLNRAQNGSSLSHKAFACKEINVILFRTVNRKVSLDKNKQGL